MIPSNIVRDKTGLTRFQLYHLRELRLIPKVTRVYTTGQSGAKCAYPASIFTRIRVIQFLQGHGFTLTQIAQSAKGTPFACPGPAPRKEPSHDR